MEKRKCWAKTVAWWIFESGEKSIETANRHESGNMSRLCSKPPRYCAYRPSPQHVGFWQ